MSWRRLPFVSAEGVLEGMMIRWLRWFLPRVWEGNRHRGWMDASFVDGTGFHFEAMGFTCCITLDGFVANPSSFCHSQRGGTAWDVVHTTHTHEHTRTWCQRKESTRSIRLSSFFCFCFCFCFFSIDRASEVSFVCFFLWHWFRFLSMEDGNGKIHPW